jgi:hypothetical protein
MWDIQLSVCSGKKMTDFTITGIQCVTVCDADYSTMIRERIFLVRDLQKTKQKQKSE